MHQSGAQSHDCQHYIQAGLLPDINDHEPPQFHMTSGGDLNLSRITFSIWRDRIL